MRKPTPKTMRKIKRRPIVLEPGIQFHTFHTGTSARGSRVEKLPPYDEYNPNRVHVARRRRATQDHNSFPRGWTVKYDDGDVHFDTSMGTATTIANGGWTTATKISDDEWEIGHKDFTLEGFITI